MRLPARILVPILGAFAVTGSLLGVLWWQLQTTPIAATRTPAGTAQADDAETPAPELPVDASSETLRALREGDLLALQGDWKGAEERYQSAARTGGLTALRKLVTAQLQRRDYRGVRSTMDRMADQGAQPEDLMLLGALLSLREGRLGDAKRALTDAADSPHKHYGLALVAIAEGVHDTAEEEVDLAIAGWDPLIRAHARKLKAAYEEYQRFPGSPEIHLITLLSKALAETQECELSLPLLTQVVAARPDYRDAWIVRGYCELTTERTAAARSSLEQAYSLDPEKPEIQYFLARAYALTGDAGNAVTYAQFALRNGFQPEREVRSFLAGAAERAGMPQVTLEQLTLLTQDPQPELAWFTKLAQLHMTAERPMEAVLAAQAAVEKFPEDGRALDLLGAAYEAAGRPADALTAYRQAVGLEPGLEHARERAAALAQE